MAASVLIVDDDPAVVHSLRAAMTAHDIRVESAANPARAAELLEQNRFCGLVLDLVLETGSGFDVLHHIKQKNLTIPTVVITSKLPSYVREMLSADHVKLVFPKPVEPRLLTAVVLGLCGIST